MPGFRRAALKYLVLIGDGMADLPIPELDGRTPLEAASTPAMDEVARAGLTGLFCPIPEGLGPGSAVGNLSLFAYNPRETFTGRAPLEAAQQGIVLEPDQVAFRCNLVTLEDGVMRDFTAGHITTQEAATLIKTLNVQLTQFPIRFSAGVSYRHLSIVTPAPGAVDDIAAARCTPPHDIIGQPYAPYLPTGQGSPLLRDLIEASQGVLGAHPTNAERVRAGRLPATSIWPWGQGRPPRMDPYEQRFGLTGAVISAVDLVKGIGVCAGLEVLEVPGATGYLDTNYRGKVSAALQALDRVDFVYVHVEAPDEASHQGDPQVKVRAIEDFDAHVVGPCSERLRTRGGARLLVAPDHVTALSTRTHAGGPVPFAVWGEGVVPDGVAAFSERAASGTHLLLPEGYMLASHFLTAPILDAATLTRPPK